jgi:hypothetical protein
VIDFTRPPLRTVDATSGAAVPGAEWRPPERDERLDVISLPSIKRAVR